MTFEALLINTLNAIPQLANKIYPLRAPEGFVAPFVIYVQSEEENDKDLEGYEPTISASYEVNVVAGNYNDLKRLGKQARNTILSLVGQQADERKIQDIEISFSGEIWEKEVQLFRKSIQFTVYY